MSSTTLTINKARKLTGTYLQNQTDEQVQDLIYQLYGLAEIAVEQVILQGSNKKRGVIDLGKGKAQNGNRQT